MNTMIRSSPEKKNQLERFTYLVEGRSHQRMKAERLLDELKILVSDLNKRFDVSFRVFR